MIHQSGLRPGAWEYTESVPDLLCQQKSAEVTSQRWKRTQLLAGAEFFSLLRSVKLFQKIKKFTVFLYLYLKLCLMKIINKYKL